jgi:hypothetical protein
MGQALAQKINGNVTKQWQYTYDDIMSKKEGLKQLEGAI